MELTLDPLDLLPEFRKSASAGPALYLPVDSHWTADGHRAAVDVLARELSQ